MALVQDSMKGCCHGRNHGKVCRGIWCSQRYGVRVLGTLPFLPRAWVQRHGLPSTPQSPTQLSQQALGIGQETGFRASEANSSGFRLNIYTSCEEMRNHPGWELNAWRHTVCHTILQHLSLRSHAEKAFEGEKDSHACTHTHTHSHARVHGLCS